MDLLPNDGRKAEYCDNWKNIFNGATVEEEIEMLDYAIGRGHKLTPECPLCPDTWDN